MAKRKLDLGSITVGASGPPAPAVPKEPPTAAAPAPVPERTQEEYKRIGVQMRPEAQRTLRILSAETGLTQKELVSQALNLLFKEYHKGQVA